MSTRRYAHVPQPAAAFTAALVVGTLLVGCSPRGTEAAGDSLPTTPAPSSSAQPLSSSGQGREASSDAIPIRSATLDEASTATAAPVMLDYPAIDANIAVEPYGVSADGQMDVPDDAALAAWYQFGKTPADGVGTTVIAAHAGSEETPIGPLYALKDARPGEEVTVTDEDGQRHQYHVSEVQQLGKEGLDFTPFFERTGEHRLVLITCGGQWMPEESSYADNVIVIAEPAQH